jgi:hypothetical protein
MSPKQIAALNAAGRALKALDLGPVRLRYRPAQPYLPEAFTVWLEPGKQADIIGVGPTPEVALFDAMAKLEREAA